MDVRSQWTINRLRANRFRCPRSHVSSGINHAMGRDETDISPYNKLASMTHTKLI